MVEKTEATKPEITEVKPEVKAEVKPVKKVVVKKKLEVVETVKPVEKTIIGGRKIISVVKESPYVIVTDEQKTVYKISEEEYQSL